MADKFRRQPERLTACAYQVFRPITMIPYQLSRASGTNVDQRDYAHGNIHNLCAKIPYSRPASTPSSELLCLTRRSRSAPVALQRQRLIIQHGLDAGPRLAFRDAVMREAFPAFRQDEVGVLKEL